MIEINNLNLNYMNKSILRDINLNVEAGEVLGIIGSSGCGKSALLRCMVNLEDSYQGSVLIDGKPLERNSRGALVDNNKIGFVFQDYNLFEHLTVIENVAAGPIHLTNQDRKEVLKKSKDILKSIGLSEVAYRYSSTLSGGQRQRAAIARTLAMDPEVVLFDDPTHSLDPLMKVEVESVIRMLAKQGRTLIISSHEMELIRSICSRVIFMKDGEILEEGTPEHIFEHPENIETKRFVHELRVTEFEVYSRDFDFIGCISKLNIYAFRNGINSMLRDRLISIVEELIQIVIVQPQEDHKMHIYFEYNRAKQLLEGDVMFTGPYIDPDEPFNFFSWPIIENRASKIQINHLSNNPNGFTNHLHILIK